MTTTMMSERIAPESLLDEMKPVPPAVGGDDLQKLIQAEPLAGIVMLQFLQNLMDLNPALRRPVHRGGVEELELWEALWTSVYAMPFDAMLTTGSIDANSTPASSASDDPLERAEEHAHGGSVIGEALLWTLESCFRDDFTPTARAAWETLYQFVKGAA